MQVKRRWATNDSRTAAKPDNCVANVVHAPPSRTAPFDGPQSSLPCTSCPQSNVFMQRSVLKEVDQSVLNAWTNRAYWGHFHHQTLRQGTHWPHVRTQFWPGGGSYTQADSDRYWWGARHGSKPITPGLASSKEWGETCDSNGRCQDRVPPESNKGGVEWPGVASSGDSAQRN